MFLRKKKVIVDLLSDDEAVIAEVIVSRKRSEIKNKVKKEYVLDNISSLFLDIKDDFKVDQVSVLIPEKRIELKMLEFSSKDKINKDAVFAKAQKETRKKLDKQYYDLAQVRKTDDKVLIQFLGAEEEYLSLIDQGAASAGVTIDVFEPVSFALARQTADYDKPHLIVYPMKKKGVVCAAFGGKVLASASEIKPKIEKRKEKMITSVKQDWNIDVVDTFKQDLDPIIGLAQRVEAKEADALTLKPVKMPEKKKNQITKESRIPSGADRTTEKQDKKEKLKKPAAKTKKIFGLKKIALLSLIVLLTTALIFGLSFVYKDRLSKISLTDDQAKAGSSPTSEAEAATPTLTPTPTIVLNRADLNIRVLNGSGAPGAAGAAAGLLEDLGYESVSAGNAKSYGYEQTEISIKPNMADFLPLLVQDLSADYKIGTSAADLDEDSSYDAVIIIGAE